MLRDRFVTLFITALLFILTQPIALHATLLDTLPHFVEDLSFVPMRNNTGLSIAKDNSQQTWVRVSVPEALRSTPMILQIPSARIHDYQLYLKKADNQTHIILNNENTTKSLRSRFPQHALVTNDTAVYLAFNQKPAHTLQVHMEERNQFAAEESAQLFRIGLYYGIALMSVMFNLIFYLIFKDKRFITYCVLLLTTFLSFFYEDGMFYYFSDGQWVNDYLILLNSTISSIVCLPFTYYFLDLSFPNKRINKWFIGVSTTLLLGVISYAVTGNFAVQLFVYGLCFLFPIYCLYLAIKRFRHDVYARFLVLSFGFVVITGLLYVMYTRLDSTHYALFGINTFRMVSAIEIIAISFAIIFKVKALQQENDWYRQELDSYLRLLEQQVGHQNQDTQPSPETAAIITKSELADELKARYELTDREIEVLLCIWDGLTNQEIAERLFITLSTTKYHVSNLYLKMDVKNRNQVQVLQKSLHA